MILNLDHLEDSSLEVLLHELRKAEEAIGAGERSPEAIENAAKLARAAEWKSPNGGTVAARRRRRSENAPCATPSPTSPGTKNPTASSTPRRSVARGDERVAIFSCTTHFILYDTRRDVAARLSASEHLRVSLKLGGASRSVLGGDPRRVPGSAGVVRSAVPRAVFQSEVRGETDPRRDVHPRHPPR